MKMMLVMGDKGLRGATSADHEQWTRFRRRLKTFKPGKWLRMEVASPRHGKHHRKFFALLQLIVENSETYDTVDKALVAVKLATGHFDLMVNPVTGEIVQVPRSVSYDTMPQEEFDAFYGQAVDAVLTHILPQLDEAKAEELLDMIVQGWA